MVRSSLVKCERIDAHTSALSSRKDAATKFFMHASYVASVHAAASVQRRNAVLPPFHPEEGPTNVFNNISPNFTGSFARFESTRLWSSSSTRRRASANPTYRYWSLLLSDQTYHCHFCFIFFLNLFFEPSLLNFQVFFFFFLSVERRNLIFFLFLFFFF